MSLGALRGNGRRLMGVVSAPVEFLRPRTKKEPYNCYI